MNQNLLLQVRIDKTAKQLTHFKHVHIYKSLLFQFCLVCYSLRSPFMNLIEFKADISLNTLGRYMKNPAWRIEKAAVLKQALLQGLASSKSNFKSAFSTSFLKNFIKNSNFLQMAFVCESQRFKNIKHDLPAPDAYFVSSPCKKAHSTAPFGSSLPRAIPKSKNQMPGPGNYQIRKQLVKPLIQTISNRTNLLIKINALGSASFSSNSERFHKPSEQARPGPGEYSLHKQWAQRKSKKQRFIKQKVLQNRQRINSIPERVYGLFETRQINEEQLNKRLGPGLYQTQSPTKLKGVRWSKCMTNRFNSQMKSQQPGPGQYKINENKQMRTPNSSFISQTCRTYFDSHYFKTNMMFKAKLRQKLKFKDDQPGPGQYQLSKGKTDNSQFQFFGSTSQRFSEKNRIESTPGPGQYVLQPLSKTRIIHNKSFGTCTKSDQIKKQQVPGPGAYLLQESHRVTKGKQNFGSFQKRFSVNKDLIQPSPGPGDYQVEIKNKQIQQTSVFQSKTDRIQKNKSIDVSYQVHNHQISQKIRKKRIYLQNLRLIQVKKPGFDSSSFRFKHYDSTENPEKPVQTLQRQQSEVGHHKNSSFSKSSRFKSDSYKAPGVGVYDLGSQQIGKNSYNIKYNKF